MDSVLIQPLTDEEMMALGLTDSDVWMIKLGEDVYGPYESESLKKHALQNVEFYSTLEASIVAQENWQPFFEAGPFKTRKPALVSTATLQPPENFWIVLKGQRHGPHNQTVIQEKIETGELLATSLISCDQGATWQKIYELKFFVNFQHSSDRLPSTPDEDYMALSAKSDVEVKSAHDPLKDGLASLAYLGHKKSDLRLDEVYLPKSQEWGVEAPERKFSLPATTPKQKKIAALATVAMVTLVVVMSSGPSQNIDQEEELAYESKPARQNFDDVELVPSGSSLLDEQPRKARISGRRMPANNPAPVPSPQAINGARNNLARMQETHDDYVEPEPIAPVEPEVGLYPEEIPAQNFPPVEDAGIERTPGSEPEPNDDGYRMEEFPEENSPGARQEIEEVGDF